ncbi:MAG: sterol-binding protein [Gammaproteobacteria bacterium]|nr:sterol-binding protein [Gammaproteobacteria bacterium]
MLIKPLLIASLESALNRYLSLDDNKHHLLEPLTGKVIALHIQPINECLFLCPTRDGIQILNQITGQPDTTITGTPWALGLMGVSTNPMRSVFSGEVKIEGDIQTGKLFQELFKKLDINLENVIARHTGNDFAAKISRFLRSGQVWSKETVETFKLNTAEFLQEETRDLPAKAEADLFYEEVDRLRNDADRLECRLDRLLNTSPPKQEP